MLQTLALIQRRAGSNKEVAALARRQERELRDWLYASPSDAATTLSGALTSELAAVEDDQQVPVELVVVGDAVLDEGGRVFVSALREAATNAARHAGAERVDVYVEVEADTLTGFVRDRGKGFDPAAVPADRRGLADSVVGRTRRAGGTAAVRSRPGEGTEVSVSDAADADVSVRVFLVDDHALFRTGVRAELDVAPRHRRRGRRRRHRGRPHPRRAARRGAPRRAPSRRRRRRGPAPPAARPRPRVRFLALSVSDAPEDVIAVIRGGARGYVTKSITGDELADAVTRVAAGDAVFSPRLAGFVLDAFAGTSAPAARLRPRRADASRARRPASDRPRLHVQGDRPRSSCSA